MAVGVDLESFGLLGEVHCFDRAGLFALAAQQAVFDIEHSGLRDSSGEGHTDGTIGTQIPVKWAGNGDRTFVFTLAAAGAFALIHIARLLQYGNIEACAVFIHRLHFAVGEKLDIGMMRHSRHFRGGDAGTAIEGREDLAEGDHLAADAGFALHKGNLETLVAKVERGLHPGNPAADDECIYLKIVHACAPWRLKRPREQVRF